MDEARVILARDRLLGELVAHFAGDPAVLGVFVGGSLAAKTADAWSDIDLRVVVAPEHHADFVRARLDIPRRFDGWLFNEWLPGTIHCVSHFRSFVKVDIFYLDAATLAPSPWLGLPLLILHDPMGIIRDVADRSRNLTFQCAIDEILRIGGKAAAAIHEAYRRLQRGELVFVQSLLDELRQYTAMMDDLIHARAPQAVAFSHLEKRASATLLAAFEESFAPLDRSSLTGALTRLARYCDEQLETLIQKTGAPLAVHREAISLVTSEIPREA